LEAYAIPFDQEMEKQRWVSLRALKVSDLTFPIDRLVLKKLQADLLCS
jgi:hypothetical protein